jgi:hypothetical protein
MDDRGREFWGRVMELVGRREADRQADAEVAFSMASLTTPMSLAR